MNNLKKNSLPFQNFLYILNVIFVNLSFDENLKCINSIEFYRQHKCLIASSCLTSFDADEDIHILINFVNFQPVSLILGKDLKIKFYLVYLMAEMGAYFIQP